MGALFIYTGARRCHEIQERFLSCVLCVRLDGCGPDGGTVGRGFFLVGGRY